MEFTVEGCLKEAMLSMIAARDEAVRKGDAELVANVGINMFEFAVKWRELQDSEQEEKNKQIRLGFVDESEDVSE